MTSNAPNLNPYRPMPQARLVDNVRQGSPRSPAPRFARLGFFDPYLEAKQFLGSDYWVFWGLVFVGMLIAGLIPLILLGPMYCGLGLCFLARERGQQPSFELMFKGFDYFLNTLIPVLLYGLSILLVIPFCVGGVFLGLFLIGSGQEVLIVLGVCSILAGVSILVLGSNFAIYGALFACFLVADYKLEGMDAFNVSLAGITKNIFGLFGTMIASVILTLCGMLLCYIPVLLMIPLVFCSNFICYRKIFRPRPAKQPVKIELPT